MIVCEVKNAELGVLDDQLDLLQVLSFQGHQFEWLGGYLPRVHKVVLTRVRFAVSHEARFEKRKIDIAVDVFDEILFDSKQTVSIRKLNTVKVVREAVNHAHHVSKFGDRVHEFDDADLRVHEHKPLDCIRLEPQRDDVSDLLYKVRAQRVA